MVNSSDGSIGSGSSTKADRREFYRDTIENYRNGSRSKGEKWVLEDAFDMNRNMAEKFGDLKIVNENANGSRRSRQITDWRMGEIEGFRTNQRIGVEDVRYSSSRSAEAGPSNYPLGPGYVNGEPVKSRNDPREFSKIEYLEQDRAELLRKLNDQLRQVDKSKDKVSPQRRMVHQDAYGDLDNWLPDHSFWLNGAPLHDPIPARHVSGPPYNNHYMVPSSFADGRRTGIHALHPKMHNENQIQGFGNPTNRSQMLRRGPHQASGPFQRQPSHPYFSRQHLDNNAVHMYPFEPYCTYPPDGNHHLPSCSCFHCHNKHHRAPSPVPPPVFCDSRFSYIPNNRMFIHTDNPGAFAPRGYNPEISNPLPLSSHNPQSHLRWTSDLNLDVGGLVRRWPRVVLASEVHHCHPIAGGAPFLACYNCFELLRLPKKIFLIDTNRKMRCGSCSTVIIVEVVDKRLLVSIHAYVKRTPTYVGHNPDMVEQGHQSDVLGYANRPSMNFSADDYDNSGYDFQRMEREEISSSTDHTVGSKKSVELRSTHSRISCTFEDENNPGVVIGERKNNSVEPSLKANASPPPSGSVLQDYFEYSNNYHIVNRFGKESRSDHSERETVIPERAATRQNSDASLATEIDISSHEYSNTGTSQGLGDASREEHQLRGNKGAESFFAGIIKKNFTDFSKPSESAEQERTSVTVNGHSLPDKLVKKAERLAGTIQPGEYWYDFRAGFWGVMGGPCLGIIPPCIEEFNYPMPENCAGGNTVVFVNGRELHQNDLDLLTIRGLPAARDRSYIIEISGRVLDENTGKELENIGKLAPTVERVKHGFGMKTPKIAK